MRKNISYIMDSLKMMWQLDKSVFVTSMISAVITAIIPFVGILLSAYTLDELVAGGDIKALIITVILVVGVVFLLTIANSYVVKIKDVHTEICVRKFDMKMNERTLTMDYELLDSPKVNDIRTRINNDSNWGAGFYSIIWQLPGFISSIVGLIVSIIILIPLFVTKKLFSDYMSLIIIFFFFVVIASNGIFTLKNKNKINAFFNESNKEKSYYSYFTWRDMDYKSGKDVRIYNIKPLIESYFENICSYNKYVYQGVKINSSGGFVAGLSSGLLMTLSYVFVAVRAVSGALGIGSVLKYAATIYQFSSQLSNVIGAFSEYAVAAQQQQSTMEYMNVPDALLKGTIPIEKRRDNEYEIEFKNVSFKYPGSESYALRNFNLKLRIGKRLAVVGMNGSGKSTMIKLLCRLYDPTDGEITLNGIDIRKYDYNEYMSIFSVVFQDFKLFSFSLGQNVSASVEVDKDRAIECLNKAGLSDRLSSMKKGLDTHLYKDFEEDGLEISGGEAQKIALARALYKNAPFIVLDEPTAALDPIAEFEIYSKFNEIVGDKTAIYISHRLSSCRFCDDIAVFHEGELIQRGSHDTLIADDNGKYYELWNAQAQYYNEQV